MKPYKAKSLAGAQRRVRELQKQLQERDRYAVIYRSQALLMAKLAAKGPVFYSPLEAMEAETLRDKLLAQQGINPDGSPIAKVTYAT